MICLVICLVRPLYFSIDHHFVKKQLMLELIPDKVYSHLVREENDLIINLTSAIKLSSLMQLQELF